ncbi:DUF4080 domain-containing protein [Bdellovibrionota bacterium FG-1]
MPKILLATLNARYPHCAFGLRYLYANLGPYQQEAKILEFTIAQNPRDVVEAILAQDPMIVGLSVSIWNTRQTRDVVALIKRIRPGIKVVLGGPEVSHETAEQELCGLADLTIQGEGDLLFAEICSKYLENLIWPELKTLAAPLPDLSQVKLPYVFYTDEDIRHRILYVEASRGCPYRCEYCLSSLDQAVRNFDIDLFLSEMSKLLERGARRFKFGDRTFNLKISTSVQILRFFLDRISLGLFLHFEMVPDRLPLELRELIAQFPQGSLQFEVGIQTWTPDVTRRISRTLNDEKIRENFEFLTTQTQVHLHADLIAGLPGETLETFAASFDALRALKPDEIQVGILKRLRGTPIIRHDQEWEMIYQDYPPYTVLSTKTMNYATIQKMARFAHYWDLIANSGDFEKTLQLLFEGVPSHFREFDRLTDYLHLRHPQGHGIALQKLVESLWLYLENRGHTDEQLEQTLIHDYCNTKTKRDRPPFLKRPSTKIQPEDQK